jgi:hypothetical protein
MPVRTGRCPVPKIAARPRGDVDVETAIATLPVRRASRRPRRHATDEGAPFDALHPPLRRCRVFSTDQHNNGKNRPPAVLLTSHFAGVTVLSSYALGSRDYYRFAAHYRFARLVTAALTFH